MTISLSIVKYSECAELNPTDVTSFNTTQLEILFDCLEENSANIGNCDSMISETLGNGEGTLNIIYQKYEENPEQFCSCIESAYMDSSESNCANFESYNQLLYLTQAICLSEEPFQNDDEESKDECFQDLMELCEDSPTNIDGYKTCLLNHIDAIPESCESFVNDFDLKEMLELCTDDFDDSCGELKTFSDILNCLEAHENELSETCEKILDVWNNDEVLQKCVQDIDNICSEAHTPQEMKECLLSHPSDLSESCSSKIQQIAKDCSSKINSECDSDSFSEFVSCLDSKSKILKTDCPLIIDKLQDSETFEPCTDDASKYCKVDNINNLDSNEFGKLINCLHQNEKHLSTSCEKTVELMWNLYFSQEGGEKNPNDGETDGPDGQMPPPGPGGPIILIIGVIGIIFGGVVFWRKHKRSQNKHSYRLQKDEEEDDDDEEEEEGNDVEDNDDDNAFKPSKETEMKTFAKNKNQNSN